MISQIAPFLVGGFNHLEKYLSMGRIIPYILENKKCSKPPTRSLLGSINLQQAIRSGVMYHRCASAYRRHSGAGPTLASGRRQWSRQRNHEKNSTCKVETLSSYKLIYHPIMYIYIYIIVYIYIYKLYNYIYRCIIVTSWFKPIPSPIFIPSGVIKLGARQSPIDDVPSDKKPRD